MNIALWVVQGLLAFAFLMAGSFKAFAYEKFNKKQGPNVPSKSLAYFIGLCQIAGAVGLILPLATGVLPILTPVAAAALALVMLLALGFHAQHKDPFGKFIPASALLVLSLFVAWGRFNF